MHQSVSSKGDDNLMSAMKRHGSGKEEKSWIREKVLLDTEGSGKEAWEADSLTRQARQGQNK